MTPKMKLLPEGVFNMGDINNTGSIIETPVLKRTVKSFYIGLYPITYNQFEHFISKTSYITYVEKNTKISPNFNWRNRRKGEHPIVSVTAKDAIAYTEWLSRETGKQYRLPTEIEWEYAARGGTTTDYWWGNHFNREYVNCFNYFNGTTQVKSYKPNQFGLYDMIGNVQEWCIVSCYSKGNILNDETFIRRGGSFFSNIKGLRVSNRNMSVSDNHLNIDLGFRVVMEI